MSSSPIESRIMSGVTPPAACSASLNCACVVLAGWITSDLASPMLARWLKSCTRSMKRRPASSPPRIPNVSTAPGPCGRYLRASSRYGLSGSVG